jgi:hypothetical protein
MSEYTQHYRASRQQRCLECGSSDVLVAQLAVTCFECDYVHDF